MQPVRRGTVSSGALSAVQRPKDLSRVRRHAQKLDVFMAEIKNTELDQRDASLFRTGVSNARPARSCLTARGHICK